MTDEPIKRPRHARGMRSFIVGALNGRVIEVRWDYRNEARPRDGRVWSVVELNESHPAARTVHGEFATEAAAVTRAKSLFASWREPTEPPRIDEQQAAVERRTATIAERFAEYHEEHPDVYRQLVALARQWKAAGHETCGMKMLTERLRWEFGLRPGVGFESGFRNDFTSRYARLIMNQEPDLDEFFEIRRLRSA